MNKITNVYIPISDSTLRFTEDSDSEEADIINNPADSDYDMTSSALFEGIANGNTENDKYNQLFEEYKLSSIGINDLVKATLKESQIDKDYKPAWLLKETIGLDDCKFIFDVRSKKLTLNEAWFVYGRTLTQGCKLMKLFNKALIVQKKSNIHWSKKTAIFSNDHHEFLKKPLMKPQNSVLTLSKIKRQIISKCEDIPDFSLETLRLELKNKIRASNKIVSTINQKFSREQNIISLARMSKLIKSLLLQKSWTGFLWQAINKCSLSKNVWIGNQRKESMYHT